jgi:hypothetical protein
MMIRRSKLPVGFLFSVAVLMKIRTAIASRAASRAFIKAERPLSLPPRSKHENDPWIDTSASN